MGNSLGNEITIQKILHIKSLETVVWKRVGSIY